MSVGTTEGESQATLALVQRWVEAGPESLDAEVVRQVPASRIAPSVAREFDLRGEAVTFANACSAGNYAIGYAYDLIRLGEAEFMLCGGVDSLSRNAFAGFSRLGAVAPDVCRPFDANRRGMIPAEGAGMLFLESRESAVARGARIYAEVLGYGLNCDASYMTGMERESIVRCIRLAHANAGVRPSDVDYICAHGTGTRLNDEVEAAAIAEVFADRRPPTSSIKSMIGHTMGAASALAGVACALALHHGFIPPTMNFETPDPRCDLDCVPNQARAVALNVVQNNGFAFGGNNAITLFRRH